MSETTTTESSTTTVTTTTITNPIVTLVTAVRPVYKQGVTLCPTRRRVMPSGQTDTRDPDEICEEDDPLYDKRDSINDAQEKAWIAADPDYVREMQEAAQAEAREIIARAAQTVISPMPRKSNPAARHSHTRGGASGSKSADSDDPAEPQQTQLSISFLPIDFNADAELPRPDLDDEADAAAEPKIKEPSAESDYLPLRSRRTDPGRVFAHCSKYHTPAEIKMHTDAVEIVCGLYPDLAASDRVYLGDVAGSQYAFIPDDYDGPLCADMDTVAHVFAYLAGEEQFANLLRIKAILGLPVEKPWYYEHRHHAEYTQYLGVLYGQLMRVSPDMSALRAILQSDKPDAAAAAEQRFTVPRGRMTMIITKHLTRSTRPDLDVLSAEMAKIPVVDCQPQSNFLRGLKKRDTLRYEKYLTDLILSVTQRYARKGSQGEGDGRRDDINNGLAEIIMRTLLDFDLRKYCRDSLLATVRGHLNKSRNLDRDVWGDNGILSALVIHPGAYKKVKKVEKVWRFGKVEKVEVGGGEDDTWNDDGEDATGNGGEGSCRPRHDYSETPIKTMEPMDYTGVKIKVVGKLSAAEAAKKEAERGAKQNGAKQNVVRIISSTSAYGEGVDIMETIISDDTTSSLYLRQSAPKSPEDAAAEKLISSLLEKILAASEFTYRERTVMELRHGDCEHTYAEMADIMGVTRSAIVKDLGRSFSKARAVIQQMGLSYADVF
jgi:DNA-binding CsgD family transcriptional regulator